MNCKRKTKEARLEEQKSRSSKPQAAEQTSQTRRTRAAKQEQRTKSRKARAADRCRGAKSRRAGTEESQQSTIRGHRSGSLAEAPKKSRNLKIPIEE